MPQPGGDAGGDLFVPARPADNEVAGQVHASSRPQQMHPAAGAPPLYLGYCERRLWAPASSPRGDRPGLVVCPRIIWGPTRLWRAFGAGTGWEMPAGEWKHHPFSTSSLPCGLQTGFFSRLFVI